MSFLFALIDETLKLLYSDHVGSIISKHRQKKKYKDFSRKLKKWAEELAHKNDGSILTRGAFYHYNQYYSFVNKLADYIKCPTDMTEEDFSSHMCDLFYEYCKNNGESLSIDDIRCVKNFVYGILLQTKHFYENMLSDSERILYFTSRQTNNMLEKQDDKFDTIINAVTHIPSVITKKSYAMPENVILRKFALYSDVMQTYSFLLHSEDMLNVCISKKKVVVLGEAGCGKTVALEQLSAMASNTDYYTLLYKLNTYSGQTIEQILAGENYNDVDCDNLFLIFDAYDEIEENKKNDFARKLNEFGQKHNNTIIVISSRNNFYTFADDEGKHGKFDTFAEYGIAPIRREDINDYLARNSIDAGSFYSSVRERNLEELIFTPYYLKELINIYKDSHTLPPKANLMNEIIKRRFDSDCYKYDTTKSIDEHEVEIFVCLEKLAFAIQCLHLTRISRVQYQSLLDADQRKLVEYSGVFAKDENNNWGFEHNNIREFLTARCINRLGFDGIRALICNSKGIIHDSWMNTLSFLILIRKNKDLLSFLSESNCQILVRFETNRITEHERSEIVVKILTDFGNKNVWLSRGLNDSEELAKFGQSQELCDFLLNQIETPLNFRSQSNALSVLSEFTSLFDREQQARQILFNSVKSDKIGGYEKKLALDALVIHKLNCNEITEYVTKDYISQSDSDYRHGVLKYLYKSNLQTKYIDIFLWEYEQFHKFDRNHDLQYTVRDALGEVRQCDALCKIITVVSKHDEHYSTEEKEYRKIIDNAISCYQEGKKEIFRIIVASMFDSQMHNDLFFNCCLNFFDNTNTRSFAFIDLAETDLDVLSFHNVLIMERMMDDKCLSAFLDKYIESPCRYEKITTVIAQRLPENNSMFDYYKDALSKNGVILPERKQHMDYEVLRKKGSQIYFDSLFDKKTFCELVAKMLDKLGNQRMTFSQLMKEDKSFLKFNGKDNEYDHSFQELYYSLYTEDPDERVILDTLESITNWRNSIIGYIDRSLNRDKELIISQDQKDFIESYCQDEIQKLNLSKEMHEENDSFHHSWRLSYIVHFSKFFNIQYSKEMFYKLLLVPKFLFDRNEDNDKEIFPKYITDNMTAPELMGQVEKILSSQELCLSTASMYIKYCLKNHLDWAIAISEKVCKTVNTLSSSKSDAIEYLCQIKGIDYVYDSFLDTGDKELLRYIVQTTSKKQDKRLIERLERENQNSSDKSEYLCTLIMLNSRYGLQQYYEIAKAEMRSSEIRDSVSIDSTLDAISGVSDPELLDCINSLRSLLFTSGFQDRDHFGLHNGLFNAYKNIASKDFAAVEKCLNDALQQGEISDDEKCFCNSLLIDLQSMDNSELDTAWTIQEVNDFYNKNSIGELAKSNL